MNRPVLEPATSPHSPAPRLGTHDSLGASRGVRGAKILVVDDEPLARQMFTDLLEAQGFRVITVARGEEAFAFLPEVELVLLDAMLPGRDGWSICREIKEQHDPLLPVIMVTARTAPEDVVRTFASGADDYVAKPFHVAELTARIESRLRVHRAEVTIKRANEQLRELADQNYQLYEQARRDAEERALLLRELDHRVRNNLSVIMGLLSMERNRRPPRAPAEALSSLESRLRSFMLVHEALRRHNYRGVPIREIAEKLAQRLRNAWDVDSRIDLAVEGDAHNLSEKKGFALALVLNELITNAFRHAFPDGRHGRVTIQIGEVNQRIRVVVRDDGAGTAVTPRAEVVGSGRSIVAALVRDELEGSVDYQSTENGTCVALEFPDGR
ncbi:MAG TPA: response regulator [Longimicrobiales bacterium]|nr:response regulator [Longimicrobiales bacterium]